MAWSCCKDQLENRPGCKIRSRLSEPMRIHPGISSFHTLHLLSCRRNENLAFILIKEGFPAFASNAEVKLMAMKRAVSFCNTYFVYSLILLIGFMKFCLSRSYPSGCNAPCAPKPCEYPFSFVLNDDELESISVQSLHSMDIRNW